jgi:hypothetical protein
MQDVLSKMELLQTELEKNGFKDNSERVKQKRIDFNEPFMLMVIGEGNYGKSTLINSLFNKQVAPTSRLPKTWKIDIYENSNKDEALLFYKNLKTPQNATIKEASYICEQEENKAKSSDNWKSELFQVKWKYKSDWIENISLIDTPGFSQFRANSTYDNFNLFGTKGIQIQSFDGFEYYFYRADFIFWCIKATKLEDADTLSALKNVSTKKANIIGIITFMERIPDERWEEIKLKAVEIYGEYISDFLFFSPKEDKSTVAEIKDYINTKINTNLRELKNNSLLNYYNDELNNYCNSLNKSSDVYDNNIRKYLTLIDNVNVDFGAIINRIEKENKLIFESILSPLENQLNSIYVRSNENPDTFIYLINNELLDRISLQKQIEPIYIKLKDEIYTLYVSLSRKLFWQTILISNKNYSTDESLSLYSHNEKVIESFNTSHKLAIDFLFEDFDGFNIAVGGIAAAIGMLALGPIGLIAGALGFLFGESKQTKVVRKAKEEITKYINKINLSTSNALNEILINTKANFIRRIDDSFKEFNGHSKEDILKYLYRTDSVLSNKLLINLNDSVINCLNDKNQLLTYFPKLLKYDSHREYVWNKNANILYNNVVDNIFINISKEICNVENKIKNLINDKKLTDLALFENEISSLNKYLTTTIISNPFVTSTEYVERLVYSNGIKVYFVNSAYESKLQKMKSVVNDKKRELQLLWDQKVIDLVWDASRNKIFKTFNDFCDQKSQLIIKQIYSDAVKGANIFDPEVKVYIHSQSIIYLNLISHFQSYKYPNNEALNNEIQKDKYLSSLKTFNIPKQAKYIDDVIQSRLTKIINGLSNPNPLVLKYKRYNGRILLSILPLIIIVSNYFIGFNFIEDLAIKENIHLFLSSEITIIVFSLLFLFMIIMQFKTRFKMKKEVKIFINNILNECREELYKNIQIN